MTQKKIIKISYFHGWADMSRYFSKEFFQNYIFEINNPECIECDFWMVYGGLPNAVETVKVNPKNIFLVTVEFDGGYNQKFLKQFQKVITVDLRLQGNNITYHHLGLPWFINKTFDELNHQETVVKTKLISIIASNLSEITYSRNYKIRYDFVMALKNHFGDRIDVFGRGFNELKHKDEGLYPYKFSVAIENMPLAYNISEKLSDCFLTHTFPLYYDCPNINRFYNDQAYAKLDITDHAYSIGIIEKILATPDYYESHLEAVIEAKKQYLMNYSFQAVIVKAFEQYGAVDIEKKYVRLKQDNKYRSALKLKLINATFGLFK